MVNSMLKSNPQSNHVFQRLFPNVVISTSLFHLFSSILLPLPFYEFMSKGCSVVKGTIWCNTKENMVSFILAPGQTWE
jgi:hypothetical protein